ncbi:hypothetical protein [Absidia glauca]|uniref:RING-type domain-containing protein n=1 Tax=Absidia glauca TaxID=4829 RepID=A0A168QYY3_ABSGL|nr:hypothetical protein [Absidia glauca]
MHENILHVDFDESERQYYSSVNAEVQGKFQALTRNGMDKANYFSLSALLTKLQRACLHPSLDDNTLAAGIQVINHNAHIRNAKALDPTVVNRLKISLQDESAIDCPICMDAAEGAMIIPECGHILCKRCLGLYLTSDSSHLPNKLCPECRGPLAQKKVVPATVFTEVFLSPQRTNKKQLCPSTKPSKKIELLLDILKAAREQSGGHDKTIVFTQFVPFVAILAEHLNRNGYKFMRYDTSVSTENRMKIIDGFRADPTVEVLLMLTKQGNVGLNLTMANRMVIMDSGWNSSMEDQAIGRVLRIGQTKEVHVHRLIIKNTVEDRIHECCHQTKEAVSSAYSGEVNTIGTKQIAYLICGTVSPLTSSSIAGPST